MKKIILYNLITIVTLLLLSEVYFKYFLKVNHQGVSRHIVNKNLDGYKFNNRNIIKKKAFGSYIFTDENGFRISKNAKKISNNKKNIYFIGGSVTFGNGIDEHKTVVGIIKKKLNKFNVINASVIGSNIRNNYYILKNKIDFNNVEKIFINFSIDDIENLTKPDVSLVKKNDKQENLITKLKKNKWIYNINHFMRSRSATYVWIKGVFSNAEENHYLNSLSAYSDLNNLLEMNNILDKIQNLNIKNKIVFLIIPYNFQTNKENCDNDDLPEKIIKETLKSKKFSFISLKKEFCLTNNSNKLYLRYDPAHLSLLGHNVVAKYLLKSAKIQ